jgi:hypothetical protein
MKQNAVSPLRPFRPTRLPWSVRHGVAVGVDETGFGVRGSAVLIGMASGATKRDWDEIWEDLTMWDLPSNGRAGLVERPHRALLLRVWVVVDGLPPRAARQRWADRTGEPRGVSAGAAGVLRRAARRSSSEISAERPWADEVPASERLAYREWRTAWNRKHKRARSEGRPAPEPESLDARQLRRELASAERVLGLTGY